jgi:hypothetical protein
MKTIRVTDNRPTVARFIYKDTLGESFLTVELISDSAGNRTYNFNTHGGLIAPPDFIACVGIATYLNAIVTAKVEERERELLQKWGYLVEEPAAPSGGRGRRRRVVPYFGVPGDADDSDASRASRASDDEAQPFARRHPAF